MLTKNLLNEKKGTDEFTQPLCAIGGNRNMQDNEWPTTWCCRIYELPSYTGRYIDLCNQDKLHESKTSFPLKNLGWVGELSSFKCGEKVGIDICEENMAACPVNKLQ